MRIERGSVVTLSCDLRDADGEPLGAAGARLTYLHGGFGGIFPKVEEALEGKGAGHQLALTLDPADAFGDYDAGLLRVEPRSRFPEALEVGMQFEGLPGDEGDEAPIYTVTDLAEEVVVVDANHPCAGERLWFRCSVEAIRAATPEELDRGAPDEDLGIRLG